MNAQEFNKIYDEKVVSKLLEAGFVRKNNDMFYIKDNTILCLLRASYRTLRLARFMVCIRHSFIRDMDTLTINEDNLYLNNPNSYPFKILPSQLTQKAVDKFRYETNYIGFGYDYEEIKYE